MTRLQALVYDICHPITAAQRAMAYRYAHRFDLALVDRELADSDAARRQLGLIR